MARPSDTTTSGEEVPRSVKRFQRLIRHMHEFNSLVKTEDCAGLSGRGEKVQYKHQHKSMKYKGGNPPRDYSAVEMLIDFRRYMSLANYQEAIPLYYSLRRMLNWE